MFSSRKCMWFMCIYPYIYLAFLLVRLVNYGNNNIVYQCLMFFLFFSDSILGYDMWYHNMMLLLTQWGWVMNICISKLTISGSDNGLSPGRGQAIIWKNAGILLIGNKLHWNLNSYIFIKENAFENVVSKMAAILSWLPCVNNLHLIQQR